MISEHILEVARENSLYWLEKCLEGINQGTASQGGPYEEISYRYRVLAIVSLLLETDRKAFAHFLCKSGQAYLYLLELVERGASISPESYCASHSDPFLDALAGGDIDTATAIARLSPDRHVEGIEYEDDFLRYRFLHRIVSEPENVQALRGLLDRWETVLEGVESPWREVSLALFLKSDDDFDKGMASLILHRKENLERWRKTTQYRNEIDATDGQIFVRGLGLLRIAEMRGIRTRPDYLYMPDLARIPLGSSKPESGAWRSPAVG